MTAIKGGGADGDDDARKDGGGDLRKKTQGAIANSTLCVGVLLTDSSLRCAARPLCSSSRRAARSPLTLQMLCTSTHSATMKLHTQRCMRASLIGAGTFTSASMFSGKSGKQFSRHHASPCPPLCGLSMMQRMSRASRTVSQLIAVCPSFGELSNMACIVVHDRAHLRQ